MGEDTQISEIKALEKNPETWKLDKDTLIKAAEEVKEIHGINFKPEHYYEDEKFRKDIEETLADPYFGYFCQAYGKKLRFREENPKMYEKIQKMGDSGLENAVKILQDIKDDPEYQEYIKLDNDMTSIQLALKTSGNAKIHLIAATYARLANIVYPETN